MRTASPRSVQTTMTPLLLSLLITASSFRTSPEGELLLPSPHSRSSKCSRTTRNEGSVSINSDTIVVGADGDQSNYGSAYVFTRDTPGNLGSGWTQRHKLASKGGDSVSIDGDTLVVGATRDNGAAYVFRRSLAGDIASSWPLVASLYGAAKSLY